MGRHPDLERSGVSEASPKEIPEGGDPKAAMAPQDRAASLFKKLPVLTPMTRPDTSRRPVSGKPAHFLIEEL
ncbi:MAG: hypothetical protein KI793_02745 [Rivularia sp. (in: Bacteria)]|nr:hypothetical protein [Rivularia sp. MS3]